MVERQYEFGKKKSMSAQQGLPQQGSSGHGPVASWRAGALQVTIWENEGQVQDGQVQSYKSVSFDRRYKDRDGQWKSSNSLRMNDLPKAAVLLNKAYEYLVLTGGEREE